MYAVIFSGGKQYRVIEGQTLKLEKLDVEVGSSVDFDQILMIGNGDDIKIGKPYLKGGKVSAEVIGQGRRDKIHIIKFRRRKHHQKQMGHRQYFTEVKITGIAG
jgi:large subunit ribosomal protein L21